jgi:hypothetical protein
MAANINVCEAVVVHCLDFRLQEFLNRWLTARFGIQNYDRISWAGGVKDYVLIQGQIQLARRLHQIRTVVFVNHEDCLAYGVAGTKERHIGDLRYAERMIKTQYSDIEVETYFLHLNGEFERIE